MTVYTCSACKVALPVVGGQPQRACACNAPIVAHLKAVASGAGSVK